MKSVLTAWPSQLFLLAACSTTVTGQAAETATPYAIVVSKPTAAEADWQAVVEALAAKHHAQVLTFSDSMPNFHLDFVHQDHVMRRQGPLQA